MMHCTIIVLRKVTSFIGGEGGKLAVQSFCNWSEIELDMVTGSIVREDIEHCWPVTAYLELNE